MIDGIDEKLLRRYVEIRRIIHQDIKTLHALSSIMGTFKEINAGKVSIDPHAIGRVSELMNDSVLTIWEKLDDFIPLTNAELVLDKLQNPATSDVEQP